VDDLIGNQWPPRSFRNPLHSPRSQAGGVDGDHAIGVGPARLGRGVDVTQRHERHGGSVAVLQALEDRTAIRIFRLRREARELAAVAFDDETGQAAFEVGFGRPGQAVAIDPQVGGRGRRCEVGDGGVGDVAYPRLGDRGVGQPDRLPRPKNCASLPAGAK